MIGQLTDKGQAEAGNWFAPIVSDAEYDSLKARADEANRQKLYEEAKEFQRKQDAKAPIVNADEIIPAPDGGIAGIVAATKATAEVMHPSIVQAHPAPAISYSDDQISLLKAKVAPNATKTEFELLMYLSQKYNLDPLLRQIWLVKFGDAPAQIYAGRDGFLEIAHRSGHFDGMETKVIFDENKKPVSAICTVWRNDMSHPFVADVLFSEYTTGKNLWQTKPSVMIGKVAESVALRKAFQVSGLYSPEEIS
jgi:phage recombination protein Bet